MANSGENMEYRMERLEHAVFGNGKPGIVKVLDDFVSRWDEREIVKAEAEVHREKEQERREKKFNRTVAIIGVLLTALGVVAVFLTMYFKSLEAKHIVSTQTNSLSSPQNAAVPPSLR